MRRRQSFFQNFMWASVLLVIMGLVFCGAGVAMQFMYIDPDGTLETVDGEEYPATEKSAAELCEAFLLSFGGVGIILLGIGGCIGLPGVLHRARARRLRADGICVLADVVDTTATNVYVNGTHLTRLRCSYTDMRGTTYTFRSGMLRADPRPFLQEGKVSVYHDPYNMRRYFVDVDASAGVGTRIVDL